MRPQVVLFSDTHYLSLLAVPDVTLDTFGRRSFQYAGPRNWRDLPPTLRTKQSLNSFKEQLKSHLFKNNF